MQRTLKFPKYIYKRRSNQLEINTFLRYMRIPNVLYLLDKCLKVKVHKMLGHCKHNHNTEADTPSQKKYVNIHYWEVDLSRPDAALTKTILDFENKVCYKRKRNLNDHTTFLPVNTDEVRKIYPKI